MAWGPEVGVVPGGSAGYFYGPMYLGAATALQFASVNPVLPVGTVGFETDTRKVKFGDGTSDWNSLPYWP